MSRYAGKLCPRVYDFFAADARRLEHCGFDPLDELSFAVRLSR
ncbi:MAG: hypothetical protein AAFW81_07960 [Pseudomonadota bacterium]